MQQFPLWYPSPPTRLEIRLHRNDFWSDATAPLVRDKIVIRDAAGKPEAASYPAKNLIDFFAIRLIMSPPSRVLYDQLSTL